MDATRVDARCSTSRWRSIGRRGHIRCRRCGRIECEPGWHQIVSFMRHWGGWGGATSRSHAPSRGTTGDISNGWTSQTAIGIKCALTVDVISAEQTSQTYFTPPSPPLAAIFLRMTPIVEVARRLRRRWGDGLRCGLRRPGGPPQARTQSAYGVLKTARGIPIKGAFDSAECLDEDSTRRLMDFDGAGPGFDGNADGLML